MHHLALFGGGKKKKKLCVLWRRNDNSKSGKNSRLTLKHIILLCANLPNWVNPAGLIRWVLLVVLL